MVIKMKWMRNKLRFGLKQHDWKFRDLIKLLTNLINQIKSLIGGLISFDFWDLIELGINLISEIKGFIEEISKFGVNWGQNCNRLKSKD
jgi:Ni,Fe-hydrogenase maturation factor